MIVIKDAQMDQKIPQDGGKKKEKINKKAVRRQQLSKTEDEPAPRSSKAWCF